MEENNIRKGFMMKILRTVLWISGIWAAILIFLQVVLSPAVLTGIVRKYSSEYIDGDLSFSKVRLAMFRHFPNIGITIEDCALTYPSDRFIQLKANEKERLEGYGETADTLVSFKRLSAGINIGALAAGKISIPHVILIQPRIFAHSYDEGNANWNMFRSDTAEDTVQTGIPPLSVGKIRLLNNPHIVFTDAKDTIAAVIDVKRMTFDGKLDTKKTSRNRIGLKVDSLRIAGNAASDTLELKLDILHIHEHHEHFDMHAKADAELAAKSFGRMNIPMTLSGNISFPKDSVPAVALNNIEAEVASVPIQADARISRIDGRNFIDASFGINGCKIEDVISGFIKNIIPETSELKTDATISLDGSCTGFIGGGSLPDTKLSLNIPESGIGHKAIRKEGTLSFKADAFTKDDKVGLSIEEAALETSGLRISIKGHAEDILGTDPLITLDGKMEAEADSLAAILPQSDGMEADGSISADIKGKIRLSQINIYNFAEADLKGGIRSGSLVFRSPADSVDLSVNGLDIRLGPEIKVSKRDSTKSFRLMGLSGTINDISISFKEAFSVQGTAIDLAAKNSVDLLSDTTRVHPLGGHVDAKRLTMTDASGTSISLDNTSNSFQMMPKKDHPEVPVLSLTSRNKRIYLRDEAGRIILTDADLKGRAAMNTVERRLRRKAFMDSLAMAHPEVPRDSLFSFMRTQRKNAEVPEWLKEEGFKEKDINIKLDESIARYFREWDVNGRIDVRTGIVMTPYLPLRNILKGMNVNFNNNEVNIDSLKVVSGKSEISAKGSLSGLRRALLGRGAYKLDLNVDTEEMDADELIAAFNTGSSFKPASDAGDMTETSDAEFLKMVVADSLDTDKPQSLIVIPSDLNAHICMTGKNIRYSGLEIQRFGADMLMKERCLQITESFAETNVGNGSLEAFYATKTKKDISTGFNLSLKDITTEKVIDMMPAIDTIMPLLKSFKGLMDCEIAATADLDTCMNILTPTINGVIRISGENLTMSDNKMFSEIAKKLKFKNSKVGRIDKMMVDGLLQDNKLEVFPFVLEVDRYTLAMSGIQNLDMSFRYHVSLIRSPMVFKVGVDLYGQDFDGMKYKIGKAKYKNTKVPVFTAVIDQTKINLAESIRNIFEKGVETAILENKRQEAIREHKEKIGYINAAEQKMEELSEEEQKQLEEPDESDNIATENLPKEIKDTLQ